MSKPPSFSSPDNIRKQPAQNSAEGEIAKQVRAFVEDRLTIFFSSQRELFLERTRRMATLIAFWGARINLTAAPRDPREIGFHIIDSLAPISLGAGDKTLRHAFARDNRILDLGSGAGFPGLILAAASPAHFTLLEGRRKRASFLAVAAADMGLNNVTVESRLEFTHLGRASSPDRDRAKWPFDVVTGRAYSSPPRFHSAAASALRPGGIAILYANPAQRLSLSSAEQNGLLEFRHVAYTISRDDRKVERILALWRRRG